MVLLLLTAAAAQGWRLLDRRAAAAWRADVGDALPTLRLEQRGVPVSVALRDLPACSFVVVLSPSCPSCQRLAPRWARELGAGTGKTVMGISYSGADDATRFAAQHGLSFPIFASGGPRMGEVAQSLGVPSVPRIIVMGEGGRIAAMGDSRYELERLKQAAGC